MILRQPVVVGGYLALYIALEWMSLIHPAGSLSTLGITPWNPPAGLSLAVLLRYGPAYIPAVFVAVAAADVLFRGLWSSPLVTIASAMTVAFGYTAAALVLRNRFLISIRLRTHRDLLVLLGVSLAATMMVAVSVVAIFATGGLLPWSEFWDFALHYWVGDMIGIAGFTPLVLLMMDPQRRAAMAHGFHPVEYLLQLGAIVFGLWIIFGWETTDHFEYSYILFLPLIWIGLRGGLIGAAWGILGTQLGLVAAIQIKGFDVAVTTQFQLLMLAVAVTGLVLGSIVDEGARAESSLRDSETRLQTVVETAPDAILTFDETGTITSANRAAERMFTAAGRWLAGVGIQSLLPGLNMDEPESATGSEMLARRLDGTSFAAEVAVGTAEVAGSALFVAAVRDISVRKQAELWLKEHEAELAHAARLTATGEMAASLAHELNQPLTALISFARACQAILQEAGADDERLRSARSLIDQTVQQALRAGEIIRSTREFLRRTDARMSKVEVAQIFQAVYGLVKAEAALNQVGIVVRFEPDTPPVLADAIQVEQVILNLIRNSMEAMVQTPADRREIRLSASRDPAEPGYVVFAIQDTGPGISPEVAERLFKPFSTTKSTGMGLGLSISRSIIEAHGGRIWSVTGGAGGGADIRFTLLSYTELKSES
ncbi:MAG TPA: ATP-binding protein [Lacipirellula sp.]